jgi:thiamine biosynthesis protein ThiS
MLVTDRLNAGMPLPELLSKAIKGGVDTVQLRERDLDERELRELVVSLLSVMIDGQRLIINGEPAIAQELGVGLHLPETMSGLPLPEAGAVASLSRSIHAESPLDGLARFDFVIAGHVYHTAAKGSRPPLGPHGLRAIVERASRPVLAIGGITPDRVGDVLASGAAGIAVMSAINNSRDPEGVAAAYLDALVRSDGMQETATIPVQINGKPQAIAPGTTVTEFLKERNHHERLVVVELNGAILKKALFASTTIAAGDKVEIVHFVGGG